MRIAAYGDSIVAGYGEPPLLGFVPDLARTLTQRRKKPVRYLNYGISGLTTTELAVALQQDPEMMQGAHFASVLVVYIGGDDLIHDIPLVLSGSRSGIRQALRLSAASYARALSELRRVSSGQLIVGDLFNPFPATPVAAEAISVFNETVIYPAAARWKAAVAPVNAAFEGRQTELIHGYRNGVAGQPGRFGVRNPVHPNAGGYAVIAQTYASLIS